MDITYFAETYTEYFFLLVDNLFKNKNESRCLGCQTVFILSVSVVNGGCVTIEKKFLAPITLCVDFSFGEAYNRMIQKY